MKTFKKKISEPEPECKNGKCLDLNKDKCRKAKEIFDGKTGTGKAERIGLEKGDDGKHTCYPGETTCAPGLGVVMGSGSKSWVRVGIRYHFPGMGRDQVPKKVGFSHWFVSFWLPDYITIDGFG